jgi:hypothetical protein
MLHNRGNRSDREADDAYMCLGIILVGNLAVVSLMIGLDIKRHDCVARRWLKNNIIVYDDLSVTELLASGGPICLRHSI